MTDIALKPDLTVHSGTGLVTSGQVFKGKTGINYFGGIRNFEDLKIIEFIGEGTAVAFLTGIQIYDKKGVLIIDKQLKKNTYYSRETARNFVKKSLLKMLKDAAKSTNKEFDEDIAKSIINEKLKIAYYEESYHSVLDWAKDLGII